MLPELLEGFAADRREMSFPVACLRVLRASPALAMPETCKSLLDNAALRSHVAAVSANDFFFFVSHRHYLARGLTRKQRIAFAQHHYEHEVSAFDDAYFDGVYGGEGLVLWDKTVNGTHFDLRLGPGSDVLYEGGLSVTLSVDGGRVGVVSLSYVEENAIFDVAGGIGPAATTVFVTRKQLASDHGYQRAFHQAFDRCTVPHLCLAAISGIAVAQDIENIAAVRAEAQPSYRPERHARFRAAYGEFWESLGGRIRGPFAYEMPAVPRLKPLEEMPAKARRRAQRRRAHLDAIRHDAAEVMRRHLLARPS